MLTLEDHSRLSLVLVHYPVLHRNGETISSAVFSQDVHDLARLSTTYNLGPYYLVTPITSQQELAEQLGKHWTGEWGKNYNANRAEALERLKVLPSFARVVEHATAQWGEEPLTLATTAKDSPDAWDFSAVREHMESNSSPVLLAIGTSWGLTPGFIEGCSGVLKPIKIGPYNHLSVRSASSIIIDRILGR